MGNSTALVLVSSGSVDTSLQFENGDVVEVGHDRWYRWLAENSSFRFENGCEGGISFTARKHSRDSNDFWYAYRKIDGILRNAYLGKSETLTADKMLKAAAKLSQPKGKNSPSVELAEKSIQLDLTDTLNNGYAMECITLSSQVAELQSRLDLAETQLQEMAVKNAALAEELLEAKKLSYLKQPVEILLTQTTPPPSPLC